MIWLVTLNASPASVWTLALVVPVGLLEQNIFFSYPALYFDLKLSGIFFKCFLKYLFINTLI